jgi:transcriptional regulator with XRE-family HTH domain
VVRAARRSPGTSSDTSVAAVGNRLVLTRKALGFTTTKMCVLMGSVSGGSAYTNYEMGRRLIAHSHALALCTACGLTLDWIYRGDMRLVDPDVQSKLQQVMSDAPTTSRGRGRSNI